MLAPSRPSEAPRAARMRLLTLLLLALILAVPAPPAAAQGFDLPGLPRDAAPQQRVAAEARAQAAERRGDWAAAAQAWEDRVAGSEARPEHWLSLARAL